VSNGRGGIERKREKAERERTNRGSPSLVITSTQGEKAREGRGGSWQAH